MGRRQESDRPADTIWRGGRLIFKKRWPVEVARLTPALGQFFQRSLKTGDLKEATRKRAQAQVEFDRRCEETLAGALVARARDAATGDATQDWLRGLTDAQRAEVVRIADKRTAPIYGPAPDAEEALARLHIEAFQAALLAHNSTLPANGLATAVLGVGESENLRAKIQGLYREAIGRSAGETARELLKLGYPATEMPPSVLDAAELLNKKTLSDGFALRAQGNRRWTIPFSG